MAPTGSGKSGVPGSHPRKRARPTAEVTKILPLWDSGGLSYFGFRLVLAARLFERRVTAHLSETTDLTLPEWRVLVQLALIPRATVRALSDGAAVDRAEVSRATRRLVERGFLRRIENPADARSPQFELTDAGRLEVARVRAPIGGGISQVLSDLTDADLEAADRVLWAMTRGMIGDAPHLAAGSADTNFVSEAELAEDDAR